MEDTASRPLVSFYRAVTEHFVYSVAYMVFVSVPV